MKDEFVMVPRAELVRLQENLDPHRGAVAWGIACDLLARPAEQHQGEPVAPVINAEQVLGAYQFASFGPANHLRGTTNWCAVFAQELNHRIGADTTEVERIGNELREVREERDDLRRRVDDFQSRSHGVKNLSVIEQLNDKLTERDALLRELAEAAEMFSCSAYCETSDAGDALELLNKILARVNSHKAPKCKVCGYMLHPDGYCSFRDCGVPGKGTKALSASAEPSMPSLVECDACPRSGGCVNTCMKAPASAEPSAPVECDERAACTHDFSTVLRCMKCGVRDDGTARAALERNK